MVFYPTTPSNMGCPLSLILSNNMTGVKFWGVLDPEASTEIRAFGALENALRGSGYGDRGALESLDSARTRVKKCGSNVLPLPIGSLVFDFARVRHTRLDWMSLTSPEPMLPAWEALSNLLWQSEGLVLAAAIDQDYDYWQNAEDPLQYKAVGRSWTHLPLRSNGLPPPLDQTLIDVSSNPGRRYMRRGFVEVVGYLMWISDMGWQRLNSNKSAVQACPGFATAESTNGLLRIQSDRAPFVSDQGDAGERQNRLRNAVYGRVQC